MRRLWALGFAVIAMLFVVLAASRPQATVTVRWEEPEDGMAPLDVYLMNMPW